VAAAPRSTHEIEAAYEEVVSASSHSLTGCGETIWLIVLLDTGEEGYGYFYPWLILSPAHP